MHEDTKEITEVILEAAQKAREETRSETRPEVQPTMNWPIECMIGPGLEGAIACESKVGYVNGSKGSLSYRGYDIFDLCAYSTYEEVSYLLLHGELPSKTKLEEFKNKLAQHRHLNKTMRLIMSFPIEDMNAMAPLRMGSILMRQEFTYIDSEEGRPAVFDTIGSDEDSIAMETMPTGNPYAIYEFKRLKRVLQKRDEKNSTKKREDAGGLEACYHLISGLSTIAAAIARIRNGKMPVEPDPELSHAANLLYMITGSRPSPVEERIMDIALILHADHGMNASTFATLVVASTLSDIYFSVGAGIAALNGPLHGGANEQVINALKEIGDVNNVKNWVSVSLREKRRIMGMGHRVYKTYDPRARVLGPLAKYLVEGRNNIEPIYTIALALEEEVLSTIGKEKKIFPNVDYYSGIVYSCLNIPTEMFTPIFAVSRVTGWTARVLEYLENNRIFRPRAMYTGEFDKEYEHINEREYVSNNK